MDEISRTCTFCCTRRPLPELGRQAGSGTFQCLDMAACRQRADAQMLYPLAEHQAEHGLALREAMSGAAAVPR